MEPDKKSNGALVGLVAIIIILVLGGVYIWMSNKNQPDNSGALSDQDSAALDALDQDAASVDVNTGVDVNALQ